jgi:hypothetical protein
LGQVHDGLFIRLDTVRGLLGVIDLYVENTIDV